MHYRRRTSCDPVIRFALIGALLYGSSPGAGAAEPAPSPEAPPAAAAKPPGDTRDIAPVAQFPPPKIYPEPTEAQRRIATALAKQADVNWSDGFQLGDVVRELSDKYDIPIQLDMAPLTADGKGSETLIYKSVRGVTLKNLLRLVLEEQGLTAVVRNEVLLITTPTAAETYTVIRIYQVHDLVVMPNDSTADRVDFMSLIELITSTVLPETWREAGGTQGEVKEFDGPGVLALVITQTEDAHEQIEKMLASLRAAQADPIRKAQSGRPLGAKLPPPELPFVGGAGADVPRGTPPTAQPPEASPALEKLAASNTRLACDLYGRIAAHADKNRNVVCSPYGASAVLGLARLGARGRTAEEINSAVHLPDDPLMHEQMFRLNRWLNADKGSRGYRLSSRNYLFPQRDLPIRASYLGDSVQFYDAQLVPLDFVDGLPAEKARIRETIRRDTQGFLDPSGIAEGLNENTKLAILNTVYFRGRWASPFNPHNTLRQVFHSPAGDLRVEMMHQTESHGYAEVSGLQIVRKKYESAGDEKAAFYIVLSPAEPAAWAALEKAVTPDNLAKWDAAIQAREIELHLPKFAFDDLRDLTPLLQELGIRNAFDGSPRHSNANFTGIGDSVYLQNILQKARIQVNEQETVAAAATLGGLGAGGGIAKPDVPPIVRCDRPFLFFIRDEQTGTILFLGRVVAPDNDPQAQINPARPNTQRGGNMF